MNDSGTFTVQVSDVRAEALDVMTLELRAVGGGHLRPFQPGAHLDVHLSNGLIRQYSLTNDCRESDRYVIGVARVANSRGGSTFVHSSIRAGAQLTIGGPINNFALDPRAERFLFVAGGIGVTPILSMIRWCAVNAKPWRLIYAARSRQRAAFYEELCALAGSSAQFHFDDERGQVLDVAQALAGSPEGEWIYCCGPAPLMDAVKTLSSDLPPERVRFEWFSTPDNGEPKDSSAFKIRLERNGAEFDVPANKSILDVLEENGIDHPFSCREGLCGTCLTTVCSGEPDHRDYVLTDEERASGKLMTICCSRSKSEVLTLNI